MGGRGSGGRSKRAPTDAEIANEIERDVRPRPEQVPADQPEPADPVTEDTASAPAVKQAAAVESQILAAYDTLAAGRKQEFVQLSKLRAMIPGDRAEVDRVLQAMTRTGLVHLASDSNRKAHTDADRAAAIQIGSEPKHLVVIEPDFYDARTNLAWGNNEWGDLAYVDQPTSPQQPHRDQP